MAAIMIVSIDFPNLSEKTPVTPAKRCCKWAHDRPKINQFNNNNDNKCKMQIRYILYRERQSSKAVSHKESSMLGSLSMLYMRRFFKGLTFVLAFFTCHVSAKRVSTPTSTYPQPLYGIERDRFVENAPLTIAVVCRDGVAVVTATEVTVQSKQQQKSNHSIADSEPLMYYNSNEIKEIGRRQRDNATSDKTTIINEGYPFLDLPDTFAGPYRTLSLTSDRHTTFFTSCGWKVDGYIQLRNAARDIVEKERNTFGNVDDEEVPIPFLANQLSLYLAQCAASERVPCRNVVYHYSCCFAEDPFSSHLHFSIRIGSLFQMNSFGR